MKQTQRYRVAADIGGTFTDVVLFDRATGKQEATKVLTTPEDRSRGVLEGVRQLVPDLQQLAFFVHGTTAGLNAFLERKGARVALLVTAGFQDVYEIARASRPEMYNLHYRKPRPLVPRRDIFEVEERMRADGSVEKPLDRRQVRNLAQAVRQGGYESVAVVLLHAWRNPVHEVQLGEWLAEELPDVQISLSHDVVNEWREYERTSTTALNAYVSPVMASYLTRLEADASASGFGGNIYIMQSNGGVMTSYTAKTRAVQTLFSGPVGGTMGGLQLGRQVGLDNLICVDMGGTSFDVSLVVGGQPEISGDKDVEGLPVLTAAVNIHTIGTGGGSIAWIEAGGLRVGPQSAGADPGPACYGRGGAAATVTDADVLLGRVVPERFLGGRMRLDFDAARTALSDLGVRLGLDEVETAAGIVEISNAKMTNAIRQLTVAKGIDPRDFSLVAYGGAGPMHAAFLAAELAIPQVIVPRFPGAFSAAGMLYADVRHDLSATFLQPLRGLDASKLAEGFQSLEAQGAEILQQEQVEPAQSQFLRSVDLRYIGQEYSVTVPLPNNTPDDAALASLGPAFDAVHLARYGHNNPGEGVEVVNLRLTAIGVTDKPMTGALALGEALHPEPAEVRPAFFGDRFIETSIYMRDGLKSGQRLEGPAVIEELSCTTVVPPGFVVEIDAYANLIMRLQGGDR